jgi:sugar lactone lactonase YvrE
MAASVECVVRGRDLLGECPLWDERSGTLWWVDILAPALRKLHNANVTSYALPEPMGSFALRETEGLLGAMKSGLYFHAPEASARELLVCPEDYPPGNRFNDGRCDRRGRFWVGSMSDPERLPVGSLYRVSPQGPCATMRTDLFIPNSLAWSPDSRTMYLSDSVRKLIWSFDYDLEEGTFGKERVFFNAERNPGAPDGSCVDAQGCLWNAEYGGWRVTRYTPQGKIDRVIELPVQNPTCCCFGGPAFDTLYITSAAQELSADALTQQPLAGSVFAVRPGSTGLPEARFSG